MLIREFIQLAPNNNEKYATNNKREKYQEIIGFLIFLIVNVMS